MTDARAGFGPACVTWPGSIHSYTMPARLFALSVFLGVLAALALGGCQGDSAETPAPSPTLTPATSPAPAPTPSPEAGVSPTPEIECITSGLVSDLLFDGDRREFAPGEPVSMSLILTNCGDNPRRLFYPDSQRYEFIVEDEGDREVWRWSLGQTFAQAAGKETIEPGETVTYTEFWDQHDQDGEPVPAGLYQIFGFSVGCAREGASGCEFGPGLFISITP